MNKGTTLFYSFHDQGSPSIIAGIHEDAVKAYQEKRENK